MNIVLAEKVYEGRSTERAFSKAVIVIGREAAECDVIFDGAHFPMVSRKHAELRWHDGLWVIADQNSSFGTFLNETRLLGSTTTLSVGDQIRFGTNGPILNVVWFELPSEINAAPAPSPSEPVAQSSTLNSHAAGGPDVAVLELPSSMGIQPFKLESPSVFMGRDGVCEINFESSDVMVSRKHAEIRRDSDRYLVYDNNSFNGTLINGQRIVTPTPLYDGDEIQLGYGGPVLRFKSPLQPAPKGASRAGQRAVESSQLSVSADRFEEMISKTMVIKLDKEHRRITTEIKPQLLMTLGFGNKNALLIGRDGTCDIRLDGLQISNRHARLTKNGSDVVIDDLNSTNGVYVNGKRISRSVINPRDFVHIGSFLLQIDQSGHIGVFDTRAKTRIDAVRITKVVKSRASGGTLRLLDDVSLSIQPNEFVGILGPSGAGKSTLMDAMSGMRPTGSGNVLVNNRDLYRYIDSLKQAIGYVPQDDVIHRELTVHSALYYVARLRLSRDVSTAEINRSIDEVLDVTGLRDQRGMRIEQLSGGQRKRVSIGVELITRPSVIFLDEPTSGLDPAAAERIMQLFHQIAESGRTVIMTTHTMENLRLFDKVVVLMNGKLVFYGKPDEALSHFDAATFADLYDRLEDPIELPAVSEGKVAIENSLVSAEQWKQKFIATPYYHEYIAEPLKELIGLEATAIHKKRRLGIFGTVRQTMTLSRRYLEILFRDKLNLFILFAQAPIIALMTYLVVENDQPRDFVYFVLSLTAFWFGTSVSAREVIRERPIYQRERMVNLGVVPYLASKLVVIGTIVTLQCLLLFIPLKFFDLTGLMRMPGEMLGMPQLWAMLLTASVGIALGLLISALVNTQQMATSLVPLILIPQILFGGLMGVPSGLSRVAGLAMPAAWSFDTIKRFSTLDTLEPEGADPRGKTGGLGLFRFIASENQKSVDEARSNFESFKRDAEEQFRRYDTELRSGANPAIPRPEEPPPISPAKEIPADLSHYISFLHPWMHEVLNQIVLILMFCILASVTLIVLRLQDVQ
ncbi:MAG: FHA domain-containing protein [Pyrinomonadaceae bacterium]